MIYFPGDRGYDGGSSCGAGNGPAPGTQYVEELNGAGAASGELQQWLHGYFSKITAIVGENATDPYAVIDGTIVAANPWEGDDGYDYARTDWYRMAQRAGGAVIFTDAYVDAITGEPIITAAKKFKGSDDVLAMDIFPQNLHSRTEGKVLPEDNELNMETAAELLTMSGMEVVQAVNGAEAVERFQASPPWSIQVILMDMQMPVMDGCQAARAIRALDRPDASTVPIIAVTANAFAEDIAKTTEAGMNGHISKPIDFAVLSRTMARLIDG